MEMALLERKPRSIKALRISGLMSTLSILDRPKLYLSRPIFPYWEVVHVKNVQMAPGGQWSRQAIWGKMVRNCVDILSFMHKLWAVLAITRFARNLYRLENYSCKQGSQLINIVCCLINQTQKIGRAAAIHIFPADWSKTFPEVDSGMWIYVNRGS